MRRGWLILAIFFGFFVSFSVYPVVAIATLIEMHYNLPYALTFFYVANVLVWTTATLSIVGYGRSK